MFVFSYKVYYSFSMSPAPVRRTLDPSLTVNMCIGRIASNGAGVTHEGTKCPSVAGYPETG